MLYAGIRLFMFCLSLISIKSNGKNVFIYIALRAYHPHVMTPTLSIFYHPNHVHTVYGYVIGQMLCNQHSGRAKNNQERNLYNYFFNKKLLKNQCHDLVLRLDRWKSLGLL